MNEGLTIKDFLEKGVTEQNERLEKDNSSLRREGVSLRNKNAALLVKCADLERMIRRKDNEIAFLQEKAKNQSKPTKKEAHNAVISLIRCIEGRDNRPVVDQAYHVVKELSDKGFTPALIVQACEWLVDNLQRYSVGDIIVYLNKLQFDKPTLGRISRVLILLEIEILERICPEREGYTEAEKAEA